MQILLNPKQSFSDIQKSHIMQYTTAAHCFLQTEPKY